MAVAGNLPPYTAIYTHLQPFHTSSPARAKSTPGRRKVKPWQEQSQPPAGAKSTPSRSKVKPQQEKIQTPAGAKTNPGRSKVNPWQEQGQTPCPHFPALFGALCSVHCCRAHCTDSVVQCRARPTNTATLAQFLNYPLINHLRLCL